MAVGISMELDILVVKEIARISCDEVKIAACIYVTLGTANDLKEFDQ